MSSYSVLSLFLLAVLCHWALQIPNVNMELTELITMITTRLHFELTNEYNVQRNMSGVIYYGLRVHNVM